jgi:anti-anti-sigma factor
MEVLETSLSGIPLIRITGDVDHSNAPALDEAAHRALRSNPGLLLLDLTNCPYLDSGGLGVLLSLVREVRDTGWVGVVGTNPNVLRLLEIVGLATDAHLRIFTDAEAASQAVAPPGS